ncbi:hypothetical protein COV19_06410 [Candidatus Woesearchaeota archaeon CG10_big_fil_rev_8_21_14_0_10_44_13]|nr:MAG: hypothetical protein COV19_06410 [Candidatus Woesearchaeota archaeon CG10_big_fil_rev_8_21_14_0_10_44_13]
MLNKKLFVFLSVLVLGVFSAEIVWAGQVLTATVNIDDNGYATTNDMVAPATAGWVTYAINLNGNPTVLGELRIKITNAGCFNVRNIYYISGSMTSAVDGVVRTICNAGQGGNPSEVAIALIPNMAVTSVLFDIKNDLGAALEAVPVPCATGLWCMLSYTKTATGDTCYSCSECPTSGCICAASSSCSGSGPSGTCASRSFDNEYTYTSSYSTCTAAPTSDMNSERFILKWTSAVDRDSDGYTTVDDCNDADPTVYPNAPDICDGKVNAQRWSPVDDDNPGEVLHCEAQVAQKDVGCDVDGDKYCDKNKNVSLLWLAQCSQGTGEERLVSGCCYNTLGWYKQVTVKTAIASVYNKLLQHDAALKSVLGNPPTPEQLTQYFQNRKKLFWAAKKTILGATPVEVHMARGNDCDDSKSYINPDAEEKCYVDNDEEEKDDDCDDGTNTLPIITHWDDSPYTGINEGCEDSSQTDCEYSSEGDIETASNDIARLPSNRYWIGFRDGDGSCCGNNTYTPGTVIGGYTYTTPNEFFIWNPGNTNPLMYSYSACFDSVPVRNNGDTAMNLLYFSYFCETPEGGGSPTGCIFLNSGIPYFQRITRVGSVMIPSPVASPIEVDEGIVYTLHANVTLLTSDPTIAGELNYFEIEEGLEEGGIMGPPNPTNIGIAGGEGSKIIEYNYTVPERPEGHKIKQVRFSLDIVGSTEVIMNDVKFYKPYYKKMLNLNGTFYTCDLEPESVFWSQMDTRASMNPLGVYPLLASQYLKVHYTDQRTVKNYSCPVVGNNFCSYAGGWKKNVDGISDNNLSKIPEEERLMKDGGYFKEFYMKEDCCPVGYCWDGTKCDNGNHKFVGVHIANATIYNDAAEKDEKRHYKCVDGFWQNATLKTDQFNMTTGYCGEYQCLYKPAEGSSLCVNNGNYTFDDYCLMGTWTSRTNLVAMQLIDLVQKDGSGEYVIFCDSFETALNDYDYTDPLIGPILQFIVGEGGSSGETPFFDCGFGENGCTNNFCVLKYVNKDNIEKVVFGTSLNLPINVTRDDPRYDLSFLRLLGFEAMNIIPGEDVIDHYNYCDGVMAQQREGYLGCRHPSPGNNDYAENEDNDVWYDMRTQSIIYSVQKVNLGRYSAWESFISFLKKPFTRIINAITSITSSKYNRADYSFVKNIGKFRRLYINDHFTGGFRSVKGVIEQVGVETAMVVDYYKIGVDICKKVIDYNTKYSTACQHGPIYCPMTCEPMVNSTDTWSFRIESKDETAFELWPDLTSKIRITGDEVKAPNSPSSAGDLGYN